MHFGTLLGAVRDGRFIDWDNDGDLGVLVEPGETSKLLSLKDRIVKDGYAWQWTDDYLLQVGYSDINWICCDIWLYERSKATQHVPGNGTGLELEFEMDKPLKGDESILRCNAPWLQCNHTTDFPHWFVWQVEQIEFEGMMMNAPRHCEKFLQFLYGPNWQIPQSKNKSSVGGNYYPLSAWLEYVKEQSPQRSVYRHGISPYCRIDTPNCKEPKQCCKSHIDDMMHMVSNAFNNMEMPYRVEYNNRKYFVKEKHRDEVVKHIKDKLSEYYDFGIRDNHIDVYLSKINRNKITIKFK